MNPPKVLHINTANDWRGGEQQLAYLTQELADGRAVQHVICIPNSPMHRHCEQLGLSHTTINKRAGIDIKLASGIKRAALDEKVDLIHTHDAHGHTAAVIANALLSMGKPLVVSRRVDFHIHSAFSRRFKYSHPSIKKIICVSHAIEAIMAHDLGTDERLCTVHSGIDLNRFTGKQPGMLRRELGIPTDVRIVGNVAAHAPHKDLFTFLDVAKSLCERHDNLHFVSIGDGPLSNEIRTYASDLNLNEKIHFLGFRKDVEDLLIDFDLFLMTSETEGLGTTILDAFAAGVPVVSTRAGGIPEMVEDGVTGLLAEVKDVPGLASSVERMFASDKSSFIAAAYEKLKEFSKEATAAKTLMVYRELLQQM